MQESAKIEKLKSLENSLREQLNKKDETIAARNKEIRKICEKLTKHDKTLAELTAKRELVFLKKGHLESVEKSWAKFMPLYEKTKQTLANLKENLQFYENCEKILQEKLNQEEECILKLKETTKKTINKATKEMMETTKACQQMELYFDANIKQLEFKSTSLTNSIEQKSKDMERLSILFKDISAKASLSSQ